MSPPDGPQPIRGSMGATDPGPRNVELDRQNPDIFVPPETDNGSFPNLKFSFCSRITGSRTAAGRAR